MEELDKNAGSRLGPPVLCNGAQIRLKNNDQGLDPIKDEVDDKAWQQPSRARPDVGQNQTQQRDRKNRTDVLAVLIDMQSREHRSHDDYRKPKAERSLQLSFRYHIKEVLP